MSIMVSLIVLMQDCEGHYVMANINFYMSLRKSRKSFGQHKPRVSINQSINQSILDMSPRQEAILIYTLHNAMCNVEHKKLGLYIIYDVT